MQAFFSGTDMSELHDNAPLYNYYLSLIVNNSGEYVARIAYVAEIERTLRIKNPNKGEEEITDSEELLILIDLDIIKEPRRGEVDSFFSSRYEAVKKEVEEAKKAAYTYTKPTYEWTGRNRYTSYYQHTNRETQKELFDEEEFEEAQKIFKKETNKSNKNKIKHLPKVSKDGTRLFIDDKENYDLIYKWLSYGLDIYPDMNPSKTNGVNDLIAFFDAYFDDTTTGNEQRIEYFRTCMMRVMPLVYEGIHPNLVRQKGCKSMELYDSSYAIAVDLYQLFDAYPEYLEELKTFSEAQ